MLLLTSTNDRLQVITTTAANLSVHASWVDTSAGAITPGRTNTAISSATTTSVAGAPAASTQRNVKTLHIRNTHASLNNDVTVQHTDGTITAQLYRIVLGPGEAMEYTDQGGFGGGRMAAVTGGVGPTRQVLTTGSGTYTTPAGVTYIEVELVGGGGGGGSGQVGGANAGTDGTDTSFGTLVGGGGHGAEPWTGAGSGDGMGGTAVGGDINIPGEQGHSNAHIAVGGTSAAGNSGGASYFGGAGAGRWVQSGGDAAANSGSGGGGGSTITSDPIFGGFGGGAGGYVRKIIVGPAASYAYAVGVGGTGGAAIGASFAGGKGGDGMIIVTEHYR